MTSRCFALEKRVDLSYEFESNTATVRLTCRYFICNDKVKDIQLSYLIPVPPSHIFLQSREVPFSAWRVQEAQKKVQFSVADQLTPSEKHTHIAEFLFVWTKLSPEHFKSLGFVGPSFASHKLVHNFTPLFTYEHAQENFSLLYFPNIAFSYTSSSQTEEERLLLARVQKKLKKTIHSIYWTASPSSSLWISSHPDIQVASDDSASFLLYKHSFRESFIQFQIVYSQESLHTHTTVIPLSPSLSSAQTPWVEMLREIVFHFESMTQVTFPSSLRIWWLPHLYESPWLHSIPGHNFTLALDVSLALFQSFLNPSDLSSTKKWIRQMAYTLAQTYTHHLYWHHLIPKHQQHLGGGWTWSAWQKDRWWVRGFAEYLCSDFESKVFGQNVVNERAYQWARCLDDCLNPSTLYQLQDNVEINKHESFRGADRAFYIQYQRYTPRSDKVDKEKLVETLNVNEEKKQEASVPSSHVEWRAKSVSQGVCPLAGYACFVGEDFETLASCLNKSTSSTNKTLSTLFQQHVLSPPFLQHSLWIHEDSIWCRKAGLFWGVLERLISKKKLLYYLPLFFQSPFAPSSSSTSSSSFSLSQSLQLFLQQKLEEQYHSFGKHVSSLFDLWIFGHAWIRGHFTFLMDSSTHQGIIQAHFKNVTRMLFPSSSSSSSSSSLMLPLHISVQQIQNFESMNCKLPSLQQLEEQETVLVTCPFKYRTLIRRVKNRKELPVPQQKAKTLREKLMLQVDCDVFWIRPDTDGLFLSILFSTIQSKVMYLIQIEQAREMIDQLAGFIGLWKFEQGCFIIGENSHREGNSVPDDLCVFFLKQIFQNKSFFYRIRVNAFTSLLRIWFGDQSRRPKLLFSDSKYSTQTQLFDWCWNQLKHMVSEPLSQEDLLLFQQMVQELCRFCPASHLLPVLEWVLSLIEKETAVQSFFSPCLGFLAHLLCQSIAHKKVDSSALECKLLKACADRLLQMLDWDRCHLSCFRSVSAQVLTAYTCLVCSCERFLSPALVEELHFTSDKVTSILWLMVDLEWSFPSVRLMLYRSIWLCCRTLELAKLYWHLISQKEKNTHLFAQFRRFIVYVQEPEIAWQPHVSMNLSF